GFFLERFDAGTAPNVVPADARATVAVRGLSAGGDPGEILRAALERFRATGAEVEIGYVLAGDRVHLRARGKAAHGARPWDGWNAATYLLGFLHDQLEMGAADLGDLAGWLVERVGLELDGASLGISLDDEEMGETSVNLGLVAIGAPGEPESATLNIRWPVGRTVARTIDLLAARVAEYGRAKGGRLDTRTAYAFDPILVDAGSPIVRSLLTTWRAVTGEDAGPRLIAGTTYAKAIAGAVSFGPNFEGSGLKIHGDDEHLPLDHLDRLIELYTDALVRLTYPSAALGRSPSGADE
ncbi:MAG: hypothetical protein KC466_00290, partial [Myxococcales bacterium]|nr:hypothetical protein [Myxococcales bacterium]